MQTSETRQTTTEQQQKDSLDRPSYPGEWTFVQIQTALKRKIPDRMLKSLPDKSKAQYLPWWAVVEIFDKYAPGWTWEIRNTILSADRIFFIGRITIPTKDGFIFREASGTELLKKQYYDTNKNQNIEKEIPFGDPASNAESMCFRRCAAKMGLALYLYKN